MRNRFFASLRMTATLLLCLYVNRLSAQPAEVIIIRHAEKPEPVEGKELSLEGRERAAALVPYFRGNPDVLKFGTPVAIYAQAQKHQTSSVRPIQTVTPLASALHLKINHSFNRDDYKDMVHEIEHEKKYEGHTVLICWEHNVIPSIATEFGARDAPQKWHDKSYDRTWILAFTADHRCKLKDLPQHLMFGDSEK